MKKVVKVLPYIAAFAPGFALAAANLSWVKDVITQVQGLVAALIPLVIAIGLLFFIWGLVQYIAASGDEAAKEEGKRKMIWGVIALFVIVSVWGLVTLLQNITGTTETTIKIPALPTP